MSTAPRSRAPGAATANPSPQTIVLLQAVRNYPSVSLLATTTPAVRMTASDGHTLDRLMAQAAQRLGADPCPDADRVLQRLQEAVARSRSEFTGRAIAIFVSVTMRQVLRLPIPVEDRVVIDPTFATRDLVRALHRTPRHVVLLLAEREARLFDGVGERLTPPPRSSFPLTAPDQLEGARSSAVTSFLRDVDRALGTYLRLHPAPLVLVGAQRTLAEFRRLSRNTQRLAGTVTGSHTSAPLPDLVPRISPVLDAYLASRRDEALELIERRRSRNKVVGGVAAAWLAARAERPEMLAVEESFVCPARISEDGDFLTPAADAEHPDVIDDVVDELIELVLQRGGWIAFVDDGALLEHGRVALALH